MGKKVKLQDQNPLILRNHLKSPYYHQEECLWQAHEEKGGIALSRMSIPQSQDFPPCDFQVFGLLKRASKATELCWTKMTWLQ